MHRHSLTQSSWPPMERRASTKLLHSGRSWTSHRISLQFFPASSISASIIRLQVPSGLPLPLFPGGAHVSAEHRWWSFMQGTWQSHIQRLFFTSWTMSLMPARFKTSLLVTFCSHQMRRILLRHLPSKPLILLSNLFLFSMSLQLFSRLNACAACPILDGTSLSMLLSAEMKLPRYLKSCTSSSSFPFNVTGFLDT